MRACPCCGQKPPFALANADLGAIVVCGTCATLFECETRADPARQMRKAGRPSDSEPAPDRDPGAGSAAGAARETPE